MKKQFAKLAILSAVTLMISGSAMAQTEPEEPEKKDSIPTEEPAPAPDTTDKPSPDTTEVYGTRIMNKNSAGVVWSLRHFYTSSPAIDHRGTALSAIREEADEYTT